MAAALVPAVLLFLAVTVTRGQTESPEYFPLRTGMEWIYDFQLISPQGVVSNGILHRKIGETVQRDGRTYFQSHWWLEEGHPFSMDYIKLVRKDAAGFYSLDPRDPKPVEKQGSYLPLEVGKKWTNTVDGGLLQTTVLDKEEATFGTNVCKNCFRVQIASEDRKYVEEFIEAPHFGSLKSDMKRPDGTEWIFTLREFKEP